MRVAKIILATWCFLALFGCSFQPGLPVVGYVDLSERQPLPTQEENEIAPLRVAVAAVISPQGTVDSYSSLLQYLSSRLQRPVERVQRRTYLEINDLVAKGEVDVAFVCTSAYIAGQTYYQPEVLQVGVVLTALAMAE